VLEYAKAVLSGNAKELQFGFYPVLFNYKAGVLISKETGDYTGASLRNTLIGSFILFLILIQLYKPIFDTKRDRLARYIRGTSVTFSGVLVLLSVSRSNILVLGLSLALAGIIFLLRTRRILSVRKMVMGLAGVLLLSIALVQIGNYLEGGAKVIGERLAELTDNPRIEMYAIALEKIEVSPLLGYGAGTEIPKFEHQVHNLFLAAWFEGGLLTLVCALLFYFTILIYWIRTIIRVITQPRTWRLPISVHWVLVLPILPLFRAQVSGQGGNFTLIEWTCLAFFFGYLAANKRSGMVYR
jgi:O-antigen ligase